MWRWLTGNQGLISRLEMKGLPADVEESQVPQSIATHTHTTAHRAKPQNIENNLI